MRKMTPIELETLTKEVEFARARGKPITPAPVDARIKQAVDSVEQFKPFDGDVRQ